MVGEWSAAYDTLPVAMLNTIMDLIAEKRAEAAFAP
jgi:hypothetical protein